MKLQSGKQFALSGQNSDVPYLKYFFNVYSHYCNHSLTLGYCCGQHQAAKKQRRTQSDTLTLQLRLPRYSQQILVCHMCWYFYEARRIIVYILVFQ